MIDAAGRVVLVNPRLEEYWNVAREDLIGQPLDELAARDNNAIDVDALLGLLSGELEELLQSVRAGTALPATKVPFHVDKPLDRFFERTIVPVKDEDGKVFGQLIVLRDISEEKELEEAREDLSNMIVHDLRSPMTSVLGSLELIEDYLPETEMDNFIQQAVEVGLRSSQRLLMLVDSLLDISRLESGTVDLFREYVDLNSLVHNVMLALNPLASEQDIHLNNQVPPELAPVQIDRDKLERVLINLIDNALKFTPPGGSVRVHAAPQPTNGSRPESVLVSVIDNGPGIPQEQRERIFDRFAQVRGQSGRRRGTGLGLAFVKLAIEAHGGEIWVDNVAEGGSAFRFLIPFEGDGQSNGTD